jgi:hypothetical protein
MFEFSRNSFYLHVLGTKGFVVVVVVVVVVACAR